MLIDNLKFRKEVIEIVALVFFLYSASANAQVTGDVSERSPEQSDVKQIKPAKKALEDEVNYIEAFPEESDEVSYQIYRKINPANPCDRGLDAYDYEKKWYDESQVFINSKFCEPALWFDNFFADDRIFNEGAAGTYVRWRNEFIYDEEQHFEYNMDLNFSVELPGTEQRLRITFQGDADENLRDIAPGNDNETTNILGLQLDIKETTRSKFNVNISLAPRIRFRYRYTYPVYKKVILRFTQELQREKAVNSSRTQFDYEHTIKEDFLFRSSTEGVLSEVYEGVDWLQALVLYQRVNKKTSLSYEAAVNGITQPLRRAINYRLGVRFRKNFHREWLFFEVAPEITWPLSLAEDRSAITVERRSKWLLFFRLEVHFGNASEKRYEDYY